MVVGRIQGGGRLSQDARRRSTPAQRKQGLFQPSYQDLHFFPSEGEMPGPLHLRSLRIHMQNLPASSSPPRPRAPTPPHPVCLRCSAGGRDRGGNMSITRCSDNGSRCLITPGDRQDHSSCHPLDKLKLISGSPPSPK